MMTDESNSAFSIIETARYVVKNYSELESDERISKYLELLASYKNIASKLELKTRGQSSNEIWLEARKGCLTASDHHTIYTKVNSIVRSSTTAIIKPKTTPLVDKIVNRSQSLNVSAVSWGKEHKKESLKKFYAVEACRHKDYELQGCGLFAIF